ncbi:MAG: hypothetical protein D8M59_10930 [Planctomycetes bacterium]|nr:hypothetical protein [Planctomycetota bacterium]NOG54135.1 cytochrome c biogenesis protein CcsA [Planctomycetota bacterium]
MAQKKRIPTPAIIVYWVVTLGLFVGGLFLLAYYTPANLRTPEYDAGAAQKIFYIHLPIAINTFVAALLVGVAGVAYLIGRRLVWDDFAYAAGKTAVLLGGIVLLTGVIWGRSAWWNARPWFVWWEWTPRLTFSLVLWLLYVVYLMIRPSIESANRRALVCAVYGIIAFLDVPLVYFSTKLLPDLHVPPGQAMSSGMKWTLLYWFAPITMMHVGILYHRFCLNRDERALYESAYDNEQTPAVA